VETCAGADEAKATGRKQRAKMERECMERLS
jgi:hypothetical protein